MTGLKFFKIIIIFLICLYITVYMYKNVITKRTSS